MSNYIGMKHLGVVTHVCSNVNGNLANNNESEDEKLDYKES